MYLVMSRRNNSRDNDNKEKNDDADNNAHPHLHVLPPHLLPDSVRSSSEVLSRVGEIVCLVLDRIEMFTALRDLVDVFSHNTNRVIDLRLEGCCSWISALL